jgi:hypothetical protein
MCGTLNKKVHSTCKEEDLKGNVPNVLFSIFPSQPEHAMNNVLLRCDKSTSQNKSFLLSLNIMSTQSNSNCDALNAVLGPSLMANWPATILPAVTQNTPSLK